MIANAYLNDVLTIAGPLIDASNATFIDLTERLAVGRREGRPWYVYINASEPHVEKGPFERIGEALAYLLGDEGQQLVKDRGIAWPLLRLPTTVSSDPSPFFGDPYQIAPGVYPLQRSPLAAQFLTTADGKLLGIKPNEFEWLLASRGAVKP